LVLDPAVAPNLYIKDGSLFETPSTVAVAFLSLLPLRAAFEP
jgi:hypothetical protein